MASGSSGTRKVTFMAGEDLVREVEAYAHERGSSLSDALRELLARGLEAERLEALSSPIGQVVADAMAQSLTAMVDAFGDRMDDAAADFAIASGDVADASFACAAVLTRAAGGSDAEFAHRILTGSFLRRGYPLSDAESMAAEAMDSMAV